MLFESSTEMNYKCNPEDFGFKITQPVSDYLKKNLKLNHNLAIANTLIHVILMVYLITQTFMGDISLLYKILILFTYRQICGFITKLPIPKEFKELESEFDIPPKHNNFFFHYSGHTFMLVIIGLHMINKYKKNQNMLIILFTLIYILQTIRILATRGHYSIDISNATVLAYLIYYVNIFNV